MNNEQSSLMLTSTLEVPEVAEQVTIPFGELNYMETESPGFDLIDEILIEFVPEVSQTRRGARDVSEWYLYVPVTVEE